MARPQLDQSACDKLTECVREIESATDAELVIVVHARSGSYRSADYLCGAIAAFAALLFLLFDPYEFHLYLIPVVVALVFIAGTLICSRSNALRRLFTSEKYRAQVVRTHAAAMFYEAGIANTRSEMGILIYLSLLERRLETIADRGVLKTVPPMEWNKRLSELIEAGHRPTLESLLASLRAMGNLLAEHVPASGENPNELPDMPQFDLK